MVTQLKEQVIHDHSGGASDYSSGHSGGRSGGVSDHSNGGSGHFGGKTNNSGHSGGHSGQSGCKGSRTPSTGSQTYNADANNNFSTFNSTRLISPGSSRKRSPSPLQSSRKGK
ncbi:hypothetical protein ACTA71_005836 [Dictyostelium dimigraforme]